MLVSEVNRPAKSRASDPVEQVLAVLDGSPPYGKATGYRLGCPIGTSDSKLANSHPTTPSVGRGELEG